MSLPTAGAKRCASSRTTTAMVLAVQKVVARTCCIQTSRVQSRVFRPVTARDSR
jgi:hypothetical protein